MVPVSGNRVRLVDVEVVCGVSCAGDFALGCSGGGVDMSMCWD